jgi:type I restriction enzyme, S subunit
MTAVLRVEEPSARYLVEIEPVLTRGFELLATAQDGVPRLRGLLLSLAAQGKLVPQDASDEPADVLLARIHTEQRHWCSRSRIPLIRVLSRGSTGARRCAIC